MNDNLTIPTLLFDNGQVDTLWDNHEAAIEWYEKHMSQVPRIRADKVNFRWDRNAQEEMMTFFPLFNLQSVLTSKRLDSLFAERGSVDPNVRWCFQTKNLTAEHLHFKEHHVRVSEIYIGPEGKEYFDFWATAEGTRFTSVGSPELSEDAPRYLDFALRIGVTDLLSSAQWYQKYLGFTYKGEDPEGGWIKLHCQQCVEGKKIDYSIYIEKLPKDRYSGRIDGAIRPCFLIEDRSEIYDYRNTLETNGISVSPMGTLFDTFHFYDPDGNRLNIYHA